MNHLFLARHGEYDLATSGLTPAGIREMRQVGRKISAHSGQAYVLHSNAQWVLASLDELAQNVPRVEKVPVETITKNNGPFKDTDAMLRDAQRLL